MSFLASVTYECHQPKVSVLNVSPSDAMPDFQDQVFHLTLGWRWSWVFCFRWGASSAQNIQHVFVL